MKNLRVALALAAALVLGGAVLAAAPVDYVDELNFYNTDLHLVLKSLGERTGYPFIEDVPVEGKVTIHISKRTPIAEVLDQMLRGLNLSWRLEKGVYHVGLKLPPKGVPLGKGLVARTYALDFTSADEAAEAVRPSLSEFGKVTSDAGMNTITVTDIPEVQDSVKSILGGLDVEGRRAFQVSIQIKVLQIDHTNDAETKASMEWAKFDAYEGLASTYAEPLNSDRGFGREWSMTNQYGANQLVDEWYAYYPRGMTFKVGYFGIDQFIARFYALDSTMKMTMLSEPDVTVQDNTEASIVIGRKLPQKTSGGGFQYYDTGVTLKVTPKVGADGIIELILNPKITEQSGELNSNQVDYLETREINTRVEVASGGTVRISGLSESLKQGAQYKIPVLGDIPLIGKLFKRETSEEQGKELVILVSPHIVEKVPPRCATTGGVSALTASLLAGTADILLDWSEDVPYDNVGVVRYNVYRDVRPIVNTAGLTPLSREVRGDATSWVDRSPKRRGVAYYYAVTAVDGAGNEQAVSNSPSVTVPKR
jgi:type IV pilus assembly protein PilQ